LTATPRILPQQRLLLELLMASGHIAVPSDARGTILWRTLEECRQARWITVAEVSPDFLSIGITRAGRGAVKDSG
jgi:hypothetical protein